MFGFIIGFAVGAFSMYTWKDKFSTIIAFLQFWKKKVEDESK